MAPFATKSCPAGRGASNGFEHLVAHRRCPRTSETRTAPNTPGSARPQDAANYRWAPPPETPLAPKSHLGSQQQPGNRGRSRPLHALRAHGPLPANRRRSLPKRWPSGRADDCYAEPAFQSGPRIHPTRQVGPATAAQPARLAKNTGMWRTANWYSCPLADPDQPDSRPGVDQPKDDGSTCTRGRQCAIDHRNLLVHRLPNARRPSWL